jgi:hypothetical protein
MTTDTISIDTVLNDFAMNRDYFESDTVFHNANLVKPILKAYDEACRLAARSAKRAIQGGELEQIREAQWREAVASTIESILTGLPHESGASPDYRVSAIELPSMPSFKL